MMGTKNNHRSAGFILAGLFIAGGTVGFLRGVGVLGETIDPRTAIIVISIAIALTMAISIVWWRAADEAVREAHKWAWYWGGSCGLMVVLSIYFLSIVTGGDFGESLMSYIGASGSGFEFGIMTGVIPPVIGYIIAWGIWWLRHR
ncbi:hypothetical protein Q1W73_07605 [Asticcacaulis sp. ZE23SCel15]|uniref:hypothetical protein n=1 Tax=Asticcacaulis sp. ZE23SCel15 TaxID=3059027 RepID=UPI00265D8901|nr:hypothetical protein [Asticcacaulis sp. ZE23SCel15]WKL58842.1 hypothetical protein Q1W73_07605 [Asticcacaulis sp. ZE23SCel15]